MTADSKSLYFGVSLLAHLLLFAAFVTIYPHVMQPVTLPQQPFIQSQLITSIATRKISPARNTTSLITNAAFSSSKISTLSTTKNAMTSELLTLLHAAIEREQQYPASAQEQQREGRVTLAFTLYPNGNISNLHIQHPSGTASLDHAALAAVHAALPFQQVDRYLKTAENYQVDVVFALNV